MVQQITGYLGRKDTSALARTNHEVPPAPCIRVQIHSAMLTVLPCKRLRLRMLRSPDTWPCQTVSRAQSACMFTIWTKSLVACRPGQREMEHGLPGLERRGATVTSFTTQFGLRRRWPRPP